VGDDYVSDFFRLYARQRHSFRRFDEIINLPLLKKLRAVKAGIDQDISAIATNKPNRHGNRNFARWI
jgi:hypothetical protein